MTHGSVSYTPIPTISRIARHVRVSGDAAATGFLSDEGVLYFLSGRGTTVASLRTTAKGGRRVHGGRTCITFMASSIARRYGCRVALTG